MKLPKITNEDPLSPTKIKLRKSVIQLTDAYRNAYAQHYGEKLSIDQLVEHSLKQTIGTDKDFMKAYLRASKDAPGTTNAGHTKSAATAESTPS